MSEPTLNEFLLARIAEDEAEAWRWHADAGGGDWDSLEARVLAECAAKRRIVNQWHLSFCEETGEPLGGPGAEVQWDTLRVLASVWADHPDWRKEWDQ